MTANDIRNIALLGHGGSGKTSLVEQMLFMTKGIDRLGKTADGNTTCDYDAEEIKRQISISLAFAPVMYKGKKINVMDAPGKDVKRALLSYEVLGFAERSDASLVKIRLHTGRTHQIRIQFSSRDHALFGDRKYGAGDEDGCASIALWSWRLAFLHPQSETPVSFSKAPPPVFPWNLFDFSE